MDKLNAERDTIMKALHSNLVLFKCVVLKNTILPIFFTFQSGSIQIGL